MSVRAFLIEATGQARIYLRRNSAWGDAGSYHNAMNEIGVAQITFDADGNWSEPIAKEQPPHDDPRWPAVADDGYVFQDFDHWQVFMDRIYRRADNGELTTLRTAPEGAIWRAEWCEDTPGWCGADGRCYVAKCPGGGDWMIDGRASNCTMKDDNVHKCWVRHGEAPNFTVDKNGVSCQAGAGSIQTHNWHGFLRNGEFVT